MEVISIAHSLELQSSFDLQIIVYELKTEEEVGSEVTFVILLLALVSNSFVWQVLSGFKTLTPKT